MINITLEVSEQIYNATLQILGTEINMTESNNTAYANITVLENSQNGPVEFNITAYDAAGNEFNLTQNNASANVIIDTVNPESSNLTIYSNNPHNTSLATLGNTLNITITANENLSSAEIMLLNDTYEMNITGQIAYASMMINASHAHGKVAQLQHYSRLILQDGEKDAVITQGCKRGIVRRCCCIWLDLKSSGLTYRL